MKSKIDKNNKKILNDLKKGSLKHIDKLTYIELGILLSKLDLQVDWASLADAHDYLGGYENDERDILAKKVLDIDIFHATSEQHQAIAENDLRILHLAQGKSA